MSEEPTTDPAPASLALWAICPKCKHCWPVAYYPLGMAEFGRIAKRHSRCPKCDTPGNIAKQDGGVLLEETEAGS